MQKRGQAAMEFLMTYGWAILAVILSIAALAYFGVLNPSRFLPESCTLFPGLACKDFTITDDGDMVTIMLINGIGSPLTLTPDTKLNNCGGCLVKLNNLDLPQPVSDGQTVNLSFYLTSGSIANAGSKFKSDISIGYQLGFVGLTHTRVGSLVIKVPQSAVPVTSISAATIVAFRQGENSYTGASDTFLAQPSPTSNFQTVTWIDTMKSVTGNTRVGLIFFDISSIPDTATINSAILMFRTDACCSPGGSLGLYKLTTSGVSMSATWLTKDGTTGWNGGGAFSSVGDYDAGVLASATAPSTINTYFNITGAGLAPYIQGELISNTARIIMLHDGPTLNALQSYATSNAATISRPKLFVTYTT